MYVPSKFQSLIYEIGIVVDKKHVIPLRFL